MNILLRTGFLAVLLISLSCKVTKEDNSDNKSISVFRVASGDIGSWKEKSDGGYSGIVSDLGQFLNGGKEIYEKQCIVQGFNQRLAIGSDEKIMSSTVLEYPSASNASATLTELGNQNYLSDKQSISGYADTIAVIGKNTLSGCKAFAHFGVYFFVLEATGYANRSDAIDAIGDFLSHFKSKASDVN